MIISSRTLTPHVAAISGSFAAQNALETAIRSDEKLHDILAAAAAAWKIIYSSLSNSC